MRQPSIKKNYAYRIVYELVNMLSPLIVTPYLSRVLGRDLIGINSFVTSIMTYFTMAAALGTYSYGTHEIAKHRDDRYETSKLFWEIEALKVFTSLAAIAGWGILIRFGAEYRPYFIAKIPFFLGTMFDITWLFTGHEQTGKIVLKNVITNLLGIVLLFTMVKSRDDLLLYMLINSITQMLGNLSLWVNVPGMLVKVNFKQLSIWQHFRQTLVYFLPTVAISIYTVLDKTLIGIITRDPFQSGYYEQVGKVINLAKNLSFGTVNSVMSARLSYLHANRQESEARERLDRSMSFVLFFGFASMFGIMAVSKNFVPLFFGEEFRPAIGLLMMMTPLIVLISISNTLDLQFYTPIGQKARELRFIGSGAVVNFILNLILIPRLGAVGAVIGSLVAETVITWQFVSNAKSYMPFSKILKLSWKRMVSGSVMLIAVIYIGNAVPIRSILLVPLQIASGALIYFVVSALLKDDMISYGFNYARNTMDKIRQR